MALRNSIRCALAGFAIALASPSWAEPIGFVGGWQPHITQGPASPASVISGWDAHIEYGVNNITVDSPLAFATGDETLMQRPIFATLQKRFTGLGKTTPYIGLGAGYAAGLSNDASDSEAIAIKGVVGADVALEPDLDMFVEVSYAREAGSGSLTAHQLNTGLRLKLN